jgi:curved DNA-binding protein CbpA
MPTAATARRAIDLACSAISRLRPRAAARTLYEVLGLPPGADEAQIKAAYRELARRLHPDVNPGDAASAERLAEINHAYEILSHQRARSAYDHALTWQRAHMQRHYSLLAVIAGVTFAVTLIAVSGFVRWQLKSASPPAAKAGQPSDGGAGVALPAAVSAVSRAAADLGLPAKLADEAGWTTFHDPRFEFTLRYPAGTFIFDPAQSDAHMHTFVSRDRRATFRIVAAENAAGITLARFRATLIKKRYAGASFEQTPQRRHWFALGGTLGEEVFLERITLSCDGKTLHGWQMRYPLSQRATYDGLAKDVLRNHPHGNEPEPGCGETKQKRKRPRP